MPRSAPEPGFQPNIVYIHSHDTGRYVEPYGYPVTTPAYRRLADEGILFRQAFSAAPTCSPSRAALLTGQSPHSSGLLGLVHRGFGLTDPSQHLASTLRTAGYATTIAGVQHLLPRDADPATVGYSDSRSPEGHDSTAIAEAAINLLRERAADPSTPFFLDVGFHDTHREYPEVTDAEARHARPPAILPDTPETRRDFAAYQASLARLDAAVGSVLDALDDTGLADRTLIVCTTDHGLAFPGMKCTLTDHGLGVLLIMRGPGGFEGGQLSDALVSHLDVYPTLCEVAGIPAPSWLQGTSLLPLVRGEVEAVRSEVFGEVTYHAAYEPQRSIRTDRWLLIERFDGRNRRVLPNTDDGATKTWLLAHGWREQPIDTLQLYDVLLDPMQRHNLAGDAQHGDLVNQLRDRLHAWMQRTDDPLLHPPVPMPPGSVANDPDGSSPSEPPLPG